MTRNWDLIRTEFPALENYLYADNAAVGAIPRRSADAAGDACRLVSEQGIAGYLALREKTEQIRSLLAQVLGATADDIAFCDSTSTNMSYLAMMAKNEWESSHRRDEVVLLRDEFPSSTLGWIAQGFKPVWVEPEEDHRYPIDKILEAVGPKTRAVVTSHVQYKTGVVVDVATLAQKLASRDVWHIVNATQSAGVLPLNFLKDGYSAVTISGVKWFCAGLGLGILCLSEKLRNSCQFPLAGWISQENPFLMVNDQLTTGRKASSLEAGVIDYARICSLGSSLELMTEIGFDRIRERVLALNGQLIEGFAKQGSKILTPKDARAGIVSVHRETATAWHEWAAERKLLHSQRGPQIIRFSLHYFNNEDDVARLLKAWNEGP